MKKNILILIICTLVSCEKEINIGPESEQAKATPVFPTIENICFTIDDNILNFSTLEDYDLMLKYLSKKMPKSRFLEFEKFIGFKSLRQSCVESGIEFPVESEYAITLLNPENAFIIGGYKFNYDFENEIVNVETANGTAMKSMCQSFTFDEDVAEIVFFNTSRKNVAVSYCNGDVYAEGSWTLTNNTEVEYKIKYNKIPLLNNLFAKITKTAFRPGVALYVSCGDDYMPSGYYSYYEHKDDCNSCDSDQDDGYSNSYSVDLYGPASKRLIAFKGYALFWATDEYQTPAIDYMQYKVGICDDVSCD